MANININHITINAYSSLDVLNDNCAICREHLYNKCIKCQDFDNIKCYSVIGICNHGYHYCCIDSWLKSNSYSIKCPICNEDWKLKERKNK
jgi:hypothetical protein